MDEHHSSSSQEGGDHGTGQRRQESRATEEAHHGTTVELRPTDESDCFLVVLGLDRPHHDRRLRLGWLGHRGNRTKDGRDHDGRSRRQASGADLCRPVQPGSREREEAIGGKIYTFEEGLARWGLKPEDIDIVIHTHLHNDHCENDDKCKNAVFYVHEKEMERIHNLHPLDFRYNEDFVTDVEKNGQIKTISEDTEILPGINVIHTPAHTEGGMTVLIDTEKGRAAITGFCLIMENFNPPPRIRAMEMEVIPPGTVINAYEAYDIMLKVRDMADILIPLHEPKFASVDTIP